MPIQFRCETLFSHFQNPSDEGHARRKLQVRFDPLLGASSRIAEGVKLQTGSEAALDPFRAPDANCPFCAGRLLRYASGYSEYDHACEGCEAAFAFDGGPDAPVRSRRWDRAAAKGVHAEHPRAAFARTP